MKDWIVNLIDSSGYWGIALLMFLENVFPPIPSELIMPLGGFTASQGEMSLPLVILAGTIGSVIGQLPLYYLGHFLGKKRLMRLADKHGKWLTVSGDDIEKSSPWSPATAARRCSSDGWCPACGSFISIPAGICGMNVPQFLLYSALGMGLWAGVLAYLGHLLGKNYERVEHVMGPITYVVFGVIALGAILWVVMRKRAMKAPPDALRPDEPMNPTSNEGCGS